jgi:hypothetical protein
VWGLGKRFSIISAGFVCEWGLMLGWVFAGSEFCLVYEIKMGYIHENKGV